MGNGFGVNDGNIGDAHHTDTFFPIKFVGFVNYLYFNIFGRMEFSATFIQN